MSSNPPEPHQVTGPAPLARHWSLDPTIDFLNHGSFGACPTQVLAAQRELQDRFEAQPVQFVEESLEAMSDAVRCTLGRFLRADPEDLAWVDNATTGVNTVLRSLQLAPGDELLTTDHAYNACRNALDAVADAAGAKVVAVALPFPGIRPEQITPLLLAAVTGRTRLLLLDHITSPTGLVLPAAEIVAAFAARGIDTLVDGAHAPGMLDLDIGRMGAAYYTGNCHKWLCTPKGCAFLHVRRDLQPGIRPLTISHGANSPRAHRSRFRLEFDWTGTRDPSPWLVLPKAIDFLGGLLDDGDAGRRLQGLREHNHRLVGEARELLLGALQIESPCPPEMLGSLASVPLPITRRDVDPVALHRLLRERYRIEVPVMPHPGDPDGTAPLLLRVSAQAHNRLEQYQRLAGVLGEAIQAVR